MKVRYHESFLFPQGQEDFGGALVFPQGQLHGLNGLSGNESLQAIGTIRGLKKIDEYNSVSIEYKIFSPANVDAFLQLYVDAPGMSIDNMEQLLQGIVGREKYYLVKGSSLELELSKKQAAAQQAAAAAQIQATSQAAAQPAATSKPEVSMATSSSVIGYDVAIYALKSMGKYTEGMSIPQMSAILTAYEGGNPVYIESTISYNEAVSRLKSANSWSDSLTLSQMQISLTNLNGKNPVIVLPAATTSAAVAATTTQTTATNTATGTVQTTDKVTGTTSTANAATGKVIVTTTDGQKSEAFGTATAGGVKTTVDPKTGVVTTQNTQTGVATQTDPKTGKTVTATQVTGTSTTGGTFVLPDGKTVTTNQPITSTAAPGELDLGKIALFGLLGLLLLRGAVR